MSSAGKQWLRVAPCDSIPVREGRVVEIASRQVAIFNLGERFVAVENRCPHRGGPLADGIISGDTIVCPIHAWKFNVQTGVSVNHAESGVCLKSFPVQIEAGVISIEVPLNSNVEESFPVCPGPDRPLRWVARKPLLPAVPLEPRQQ
ncbi:MAG: nitrite reductase small subunit NirD [Acidobacteria bacterium]|nr:nitrite reductase small subunit NirD [Acidobacteriota bacterium]MBS1867833.1 nitrite reductase small subunit NirD [Acidobacteriota bacterium]